MGAIAQVKGVQVLQPIVFAALGMLVPIPKIANFSKGTGILELFQKPGSYTITSG